MQVITATKYYPLGTVFKNGAHECTVLDILRTYNSGCEMVQIRYVAGHKFLGQFVRNNDIAAVTIAKGFIAIGETKPEISLNWFTSAFN